MQVEGLLAHIVMVLVTYHTYIITMMATTSSTMMGNNGIAAALTALPPLHNNHDYDGQGGCSFGRASFPKATGKGGSYYNDDDYDVQGGCSFSQVLLSKAKGKGYNDYYDGQVCCSFWRRVVPHGQVEGGWL
jgi:hypothetical protein